MAYEQDQCIAGSARRPEYEKHVAMERAAKSQAAGYSNMSDSTRAIGNLSKPPDESVVSYLDRLDTEIVELFTSIDELENRIGLVLRYEAAANACSERGREDSASALITRLRDAVSAVISARCRINGLTSRCTI